MLTQDEWNEKQRAERKSEFSWNYNGPTTQKSMLPNYSSVNEEDDDDNDLVGPSLDMFLPSDNPNKQSTITSKSFKRPIHNELDDEPSATKNKSFKDNGDDLDNIPLPSEPRKGTEIAPPPTYEYYGPSGRGPKLQKHFISTDDMKDSISKGLKIANSRNKQVRDNVDDE